MSSAEKEVRAKLIGLIEQQDLQSCYQTFRRIVPPEIFPFFKFRQPSPPKRLRKAGGHKTLVLHANNLLRRR